MGFSIRSELASYARLKRRCYFLFVISYGGLLAGLTYAAMTPQSPPLWIGQDGKSTRRDFAGDEPLMLAKRLPDTKVVVSRNRIEGVKLIVEPVPAQSQA